MGDDLNLLPPGLAGSPQADSGELIAPGDVYATVTGPRQATALEFIWKDGRSFSVPYAFLPVLWWEPPGKLVIEYLGLFSVVLYGRELNELRRQINDHRVIWIREFDEHQAGGLACVVTRMDILRLYPSREIGQ